MQLEIVITQYADHLRRFLRRHLRNEADVDDCCQETLLHLWQRLTRGGLNDDIKGYIFTTALNVIRDKRRYDRSRKQDLHVELSQNDALLRTKHGEVDLYWREALRRVETELGKLDPATRSVFVLYHVEQLSVMEIVARLDISRRTVERALARALDHITVALGNIFDIHED